MPSKVWKMNEIRKSSSRDDFHEDGFKSKVNDQNHIIIVIMSLIDDFREDGFKSWEMIKIIKSS